MLNKIKIIFAALGAVLVFALVYSYVTEVNIPETRQKAARTKEFSLPSVPADYAPMLDIGGERVAGERADFVLSQALPDIVISKNLDGQNYSLRTRLQVEKDKYAMVQENGRRKWPQIFPGVDYTSKIHDGYAQERLEILSPAAAQEFRYELSISPADEAGLELYSGHILARNQTDQKAIFLLRLPQGVDDQEQRVDYAYELKKSDVVGVYELRVYPRTPEQISLASYPVTLDVSLQVVDWDEVAIKVGDGDIVNHPGTTADGDIVSIKRAGWNWSLAERREYLIARAPKLDSSREKKLLSRYDLEKFEQAIVNLSQDEKNEIDPPDEGARYGIDYTRWLSQAEIELARDRQKESPILDLRDKSFEEIFIKKQTGQLSVVPDERRLVYSEPKIPWTKKLARMVFKSARAAGTITKTVGSGGGRDYSTIDSWVAAFGGGADGDLVTATEIRQAELYDDGDFVDDIDINGFITNASYYPRIYAPASQRHNGTENSGVRIVGADVADVVDINDNYVRMEYVEVVGFSPGSTFETFDVNASNFLLTNSLVYNAQDHTFMVDTAAGASAVVYNTVIYDSVDSGIRLSASVTLTAYNVTCDTTTESGSACFEQTTGTFIVKNSIGLNGIAGAFVGAYDGSSGKNMSDDTTAPGYDFYRSRTETANASPGAGDWVIFTNLTAGSENYHLQTSAENDALDTASSSPGTIAGIFNDDFEGDARPFGSAWDIGADEFYQFVVPADAGIWLRSGTFKVNLNDIDNWIFVGLLSPYAAVLLRRQVLFKHRRKKCYN